jgi:hypothetical protein
MLMFTTSGSQAVGAANLTSGFLVWPDPNISLAISDLSCPLMTDKVARQIISSWYF